MSKCRIDDIVFDEDSPRPAILTFENGVIQPGQESNLSCEMYKCSKSKKYAVAVASDKMLYTGMTNREEDLCNSFLAIRDKRTNKLRLIAVDYLTLCPVVLDEQDSLNKSSTSKSVLELQKEFGSKRVKRRLELQDKLNMDIDNVREELENTVKDVTIDETEMVKSECGNDHVPPIDRRATTVENVYVLKKIVPKNVIGALSNCLSVLEEESFKSSLTPFVQKIMSNLKSGDSYSVKCALLLYIDSLFKFLATPIKTIATKKYNACTFCQELGSHIIAKFTTPAERGPLRPNSMRDKSICYILVVSMIVSDYTLDIGLISKEIKIGVKKLQEICRVLAFTPTNTKDKLVMTLKLPLPAPVSTAPTPRGKSRKN